MTIHEDCDMSSVIDDMHQAMGQQRDIDIANALQAGREGACGTEDRKLEYVEHMLDIGVERLLVQFYIDGLRGVQSVHHPELKGCAEDFHYKKVQSREADLAEIAAGCE